MEIIKVKASKHYDVMIGSDILQTAGSYISNIIPKGNAVIVSDDTVFPLYGDILKKSLDEAGFKTTEFVFEHGEKSKNLTVYGTLLETMCAKHITRSDFIIALGGGVVGDLAGFAAATYQRGINFVQIPTTLLAAVDSSVGGKTAVDLSIGKNQVGCFYQPSLVLCDINTFKTLPDAEYRNGCAEIIKYAMIGNEPFFRDIRDIPVSKQYEKVISTCVAMKSRFVERDEFDKGCRMFLNFGHTIGHAVEACSNYAVPHGQAVAIGMAAITRSACARNICDEGTLDAILDILKKYGLPSEVAFSAEDLVYAIFNDKKSSGDCLNLVLPEHIGKCRLEKIQKTELRDWLKDGGII